MNFAIRLSCILALLFCLASTGSAGAIDRDRRKLQDLQRRSDGNTDPDVQIGITYEAVNIYKKYRGQADSDAAVEAELNADVAEFESNVVFVEGVPMQGGILDWFKNILKADLAKGKDSKTQKMVNKISEYVVGKLAKKL